MADKKTHGVEASSREYARYDQVRKEQDYHLSDATDTGDAYDEVTRIRTVDFGRFLHGDEADQRACARDLGAALRGIGFAVLEGHGVDPRLYDEAAERVEEFYGSVPLEERLRFRAARHGSVNQGYFPMRETTDIHPDLVEGWVFCRRAFALDGAPPEQIAKFWPRPEMEPFWRRLCLEHERLILPIMQSILLDLGCDPHLYDQRLSGTNFGLRLNYYPPLSAADEASGAARILGHEDVDLFTFLPAPGIEGLQVLNRANMKWVRLNPPRGTIILNTGDYMQRISNDLLPSTTHRVVKPRDPALRRRARVSFPMAVYLWEEEVLEVLPGLGEPRYRPVKALEFHTRTTSKYYGDDYAVTES